MVFTNKAALFFLNIFLCYSFIFAVERCELLITACPETFDGDTILVPDKVVKLSSMIRACKASQTLQTSTGGSASIMFIIDNSGSMKGTNGNDPTGSRFTVTRSLLDSIYKSQPDAEVGLIVFREHLFFDTSSTEYYADFFKALNTVLDDEPNQAYLPFLKLNQNYGSKKGIDIIKDILVTNSSGGDLVYQPPYRNIRPLSLHGGSGETNINGAFEGAKQAFANASNPKDRQFIIFLSDGEPAGSAQAGLPSNYYEQGINIPTTFTVYFTDQNQAPASLVNMTNNIKNNGYSSSNPRSNIWPLQTSYDALLNLLMQNVISTILVSGNPLRMSVNSKSSNIYIDSSFFFVDSFPIINELTKFTMDITYRYVNPKTNILKDTTVTITIYFKKVGQTAPALPNGMTMLCKDYPGPISEIPVVATLLDTNRNGHLDRIDITWPGYDTITLRQTMPLVSELISTLEITTLDGQKIKLTAISIVPDAANKTIHIILSENTGISLETGWKDARIVLSNVPMTSGGSPFVVSRIVDGAAPVIKSVCFVPMGGADSLRVYFSEPVDNLNPPLDPAKIFTLYTREGRYQFNPSDYSVIKYDDMFVYIFNTTNLSNMDSLVEGNRPPFHLSLCGDVSIIQDYKVIGNPFIPGQTMVPGTFGNVLQPATRIEVTLVPAIIATLSSGKIKATITIFDAVGNTVVEKADMAVDLATIKLLYLWDGKTQKGSLAAPGTYLARITIEDLERGRKQNIQTRIGIKKVSR